MSTELVLLLVLLVAIATLLAFVALRRRPPLHVEAFRVPVDVATAVDACRRALRTVDWREHTTDTLALALPSGSGAAAQGSGGGPALDIALSVVTSLVVDQLARRMLPKPTARAPTGPPAVDAELYAVWRDTVVVRISLVDAGSPGSDVIISGSGLDTVGGSRRVREAVGELKRSIRIQCGSLTPGGTSS